MGARWLFVFFLSLFKQYFLIIILVRKTKKQDRYILNKFKGHLSSVPISCTLCIFQLIWCDGERMYMMFFNFFLACTCSIVIKATIPCFTFMNIINSYKNCSSRYKWYFYLLLEYRRNQGRIQDFKLWGRT